MTVGDGTAVIDVKKPEITTQNTEKDNSPVLWIVIGIVGFLAVGGAVALFLLKNF